MKTLKLMIKTHRRTGLKYLCVTTRRNHEAYTGSGQYWKHHLKKHGKDFKTELLIELPMTSVEEFNFKCQWISEWYDVVESEEWANLCHEGGYVLNDGSRKKMSDAKKGRILSEEHRQKISEAGKGRTHSDESRNKISEAKKGKPLSEETRHRMSKTRKGRKLSEEHCQRISESKKGKKPPNFGKTHSEESRRKMSEARKAYHANKNTNQN